VPILLPALDPAPCHDVPRTGSRHAGKLDLLNATVATTGMLIGGNLRIQDMRVSQRALDVAVIEGLLHQPQIARLAQ
jgi:hypothetical protein